MSTHQCHFKTLSIHLSVFGTRSMPSTRNGRPAGDVQVVCGLLHIIIKIFVPFYPEGKTLQIRSPLIVLFELSAKALKCPSLLYTRSRYTYHPSYTISPGNRCRLT